jgi:acyl-CoA synthetase (AMP-forming)/AMP-acid ligase II
VQVRSGTQTRTLAGLLAAQAAVGGERLAVAYPDSSLTFAELYAGARRLARAMLAAGLQAEDRVGIFMPNSLEYIQLIFAASLLGAQLVPINARFKRRELSHVVGSSGISILFTSPAIAGQVDFPGLLLDSLPGLGQSTGREPLALESHPALRRVVITGGSDHACMMPLAQFVESGQATAEAELDAAAERGSPDAVAFVLYTSGTAAAPKGCELTSRAVINAWQAYADAVDVQADTPVWAPCPLFHVGGIGPLTATVLRGATFVSAPHFVASDALEQVVGSGAVHLFPAFPAFTLGILRTPAYRPERLANVRTVLNVAPPETEELIQSMLPGSAVLLNDFGMTEGAGMVTFTPVSDSMHDRCRTNGIPFPGVELRIVAEDGHTEVESGVAGEIQFRGINAMRGYLNDPEATAAAILEGGWVRTGDQGRVTDTGRLVYIARIKEILKVGGENVAPAEVEAWLSTHPAVAVAQIVGKQDEKYGEVPVAFVELLPGASCPPEILIEHCRGQLANFKIPREIRFVTEWPMSATKIQKFRLREML